MEHILKKKQLHLLENQALIPEQSHGEHQGASHQLMANCSMEMASG